MFQYTFVRLYTTLLQANAFTDYVTRNLHKNYRRLIDDPVTSVGEPVGGHCTYDVRKATCNDRRPASNKVCLLAY